MPQVEVGELKFIVLATHRQAFCGRPTRRGERQVGAERLVDQVPLDAGEGAANQPTAGIDERHLRLRLGLHLIEHARQRRLHQHATNDAVAEQHRTGRRQRRRWRTYVTDVLVAQRVIVAAQHRLHHRLARQIGPAPEDEPARIGRIRLADLQDGFSARVEHHHRAQAVVHFEGHDQLPKGGGIAGPNRLIDPLGVGNQADGRHLAPLELDRRVQGGVLRVDQLVPDPVLQRGGDQAGRQVAADHAQDQHQQQEGQDDLGADFQRRHRQTGANARPSQHSSNSGRGQSRRG